ncbi:predicted protein [Histoplasma capsulatum H143]|uniref:Uncharacterized protein n=1 Tax=Ajellomyces capsulatus (strain H143) TaxID=544712 RepID=C6HHF5_AJECH|nr:predicted protein [Histoplasma capsulatum H143]
MWNLAGRLEAKHGRNVGIMLAGFEERFHVSLVAPTRTLFLLLTVFAGGVNPFLLGTVKQDTQQQPWRRYVRDTIGIVVADSMDAIDPSSISIHEIWRRYRVQLSNSRSTLSLANFHSHDDDDHHVSLQSRRDLEPVGKERISPWPVHAHPKYPSGIPPCPGKIGKGDNAYRCEFIRMISKLFSLSFSEILRRTQIAHGHSTVGRDIQYLSCDPAWILTASISHNVMFRDNGQPSLAHFSFKRNGGMWGNLADSIAFPTHSSVSATD